MSFNILDAVKGHFGSELIGKAASFLGESESGVSKAIGGILPTVLSGLNSKAGSSEGANEIAQMASSTHSSGLLGNLGSFFGGGDLLSKGAGILTGLFGGKLSGIVDTISSFAGIKSDSANKLMSMAAPVALGALGKHAADSGLGASGIASLLSSSSSSWSSMLPSGLSSIIGGLGIGGVASAVSSGAHEAKEKVAGYASGAGSAVKDAASGGSSAMKWLLPLLLLGGIGAAAWYFFNKPKTGEETTNKTEVTPPPTTNTTNTTNPMPLPKVSVDTVTGLVTYDLGADTEFDLGNGTKIKAAANGFESQLLNFIKTGTIDTVDKKANWFDLHNVQFVKGKTVYAGMAEQQVKNTAAILKAYPKVVLKIGGYTDIDGDPAANKKLSQDRASKVKADLISNGAKAEQIKEAMGYGSEFAKALKGDKEGMARDRKVAAKVASK